MAEAVLHLAGAPEGDAEATRHLVRAARAAEVRHLVSVPVIGAGRIPLDWFAAERAVADSGLPWTTLRRRQPGAWGSVVRHPHLGGVPAERLGGSGDGPSLTECRGPAGPAAR